MANFERQNNAGLRKMAWQLRRVQWMLVLGLLVGCGGPRVYKVNPDAARQTLVQVLDRWQSGETLESLRDHTPEIVVQDFDWAGGAKLTGYKILSEGEVRDANLSVSVKLNLVASNGKETTKVVRYLVGTAPVLTVFRDMF